MKKKQNGFVLLCKAMGILIRESPVGMLFLLIFFNLGYGFSSGYNAKVTQYFFDTVTEYVQVPEGFGHMAAAGAVLGVFILLSRVMETAVDTMGFVYHRWVAGPVTELLNLKAGRIDPICYDDPKFLDEIDKGSRGPLAMTFTLRLIFSIFFCYGVNFVVMGVYLYQQKPILAIMPIVIFVPIAITQLMRTAAFTNLEEAIAPIRRETQFYQECIGSREYFKETRTLNAFGYFRHLFDCAIGIYNKEYWKAEKKRGLVDLISKLMSLAGFGLVLWLLVDAVWNREISIGAFAAIFASIQSMFQMMERMIIYQFGHVLQQFGNVRNFVLFMELPEREGKDVEITLQQGIEVRDVNFQYPGTDKPALSDINLSIQAGETLAIVGENGSGKSTLVKLLLGLYLPQSGTISYDGQDISEVSGDSIFQKTSAVFQDFQRYKLTIKDNVAISNLDYAAEQGGFDQEITHLLNDTTDDVISLQTHQFLREMGIDCLDELKYPEGMNTLLDREFGGIDLSGGQWQKIAIARGLFRKHNLIALDEPTAAIDPIEETRLYKQFMAISRDVTSLIVTHRLGSVRIADRIVVMDHGRIVQIGTHEELMNQPGKYGEMWKAQAKYYQEG